MVGCNDENAGLDAKKRSNGLESLHNLRWRAPVQLINEDNNALGLRVFDDVAEELLELFVSTRDCDGAIDWNGLVCEGDESGKQTDGREDEGQAAPDQIIEPLVGITSE